MKTTKKTKTTPSVVVIPAVPASPGGYASGLDLGDRSHFHCVLDATSQLSHEAGTHGRVPAGTWPTAIRFAATQIDKRIISDTLSGQMKAERPLKVIFFKTDTGNEPVREWLKTLSKEDCKVIGTDILTVQYAWPIGKPLVDNLGDGIWEVRSRLDNRIARTLFALVDQEIVLLHGFIKKQQKTPQGELELAKKRKRQFLL